MKAWLFAALLLLPGVALAQAPEYSYSGPLNDAGNPTLKAASTANPLPTAPGSLRQRALDVASVTTGGTAVTAINAGNRVHGGWIYNPLGAGAALCINEIGTATTTTAGSTTCIPADRTYNVSPGAGSVSVNSSDSTHPFSGLAFGG